VDVLNALYNELYAVALEAIDRAPHPEQITIRLDDFANAIQSVRITGSVEKEHERRASNSREDDRSVALQGDTNGALRLTAKAAREAKHTTALSQRTRRAGTETIHLNFGNINTALNGLIDVLGAPRLWLLIDEWSEAPLELQPYLADLLRRTVLPISAITVKIAAIEHRSNFALQERGTYVGLELGADISADLNLDDFLVFDNDQQKATEFFKTLLFRHYISSAEPHPEVCDSEALVQIAFTQLPVFEEFVRAAEGVAARRVELGGEDRDEGVRAKDCNGPCAHCCTGLVSAGQASRH
jgi:hypothetical protein